MKYLSIFSGIEAASVAWEPLGWEPVAFAEVDPFPCAVLSERYPRVPNLGDVTLIDWSPYHGTVDVLIGGSPCQSFSVAGGRESLDGPSRLMFEFCRAVREVKPRYFVWENVPGCLSTKDNAFGQLLDEMEKSGYSDIAWRVLDAQFFGVAQRRRRVFLVGRLGEGFCSAAVLFERESLCGDYPTSREKRNELAAAIGRGPATEGGGGSPLAFKYSAGAKAQTMPCHHEMTNTLTADWHSPAVAMQTGHTKGNGSGFNTEEVSYTLSRANDHAVAFAQNNRMEVRLIGGEGDHVGALAAQPDFGKGQGGSLICMASGQANAEISGGGDPSPALMARQYKDPPFLVHQTGKTYSRHSARQTGTSSSSTTNQSTEEDLSSTDGSPFDSPILIDRAAFNQGINAKYPPTSK